MTSWDNNKRMTRRTPVRRDASWVVSRRRRFKTIEVEEAVQVVDVSVSGLGIEAPGCAPIPAGTVLVLTCAGERCRVRILRVGTVPGSGEPTYGVEVINPRTEFVDAMIAGTELDRAGASAEFWRGSSNTSA
jgi:hypothetical protein